MARNVEKDAIREQERRERLLQAGLELFAEEGIENVSLQEVADRAEVGIATLYNYYQNKIKFVVAISAHMWGNVWQQYYNHVDLKEFDSLNAYQRVEEYLNIIIDLYRNHPEVLKFSSDYKTFIRRHHVDKAEVIEHLNAIKPVNNMFHISFERAKDDKSIRSDILEEELFTTITLTMLGMAERYAVGIVWSMKEDNDYVNELTNLKEMILKWIRN